LTSLVLKANGGSTTRPAPTGVELDVQVRPLILVVVQPNVEVRLLVQCIGGSVAIGEIKVESARMPAFGASEAEADNLNAGRPTLLQMARPSN
jgi:hypothetical protein